MGRGVGGTHRDWGRPLFTPLFFLPLFLSMPLPSPLWPRVSILGHGFSHLRSQASSPPAGVWSGEACSPAQCLARSMRGPLRRLPGRERERVPHLVGAGGVHCGGAGHSRGRPVHRQHRGGQLGVEAAAEEGGRAELRLL